MIVPKHKRGGKMIVAIIVTSLLAIAVFTYILFIGANMNKTDEERELEDKEQIEYLRNYKNGGNKVESKKKNKTSL